MSYLIALIAILFLIGSFSFAFPSAKMRRLSKLRLDAKKHGFNIFLTQSSKKDFLSKDVKLIHYQLKNITNLHDAHFVRANDGMICEGPVKLKFSQEFDKILSILNQLPPSVQEIISYKKYIHFLWDEKNTHKELNVIKDIISKILV